MKYGKHTDLVEAFLTHLKSGNVDWDAAYVGWGAADAARNAATDAAWDAWNAARAAAWSAASAARDATLATPRATEAAAGYAAYEIISHELLAEQSKPLVFLPMFGIESIEQLKEMMK